jgi:ABC-type antimicrobial peptide transport system permease subunit
MSDNSTRHIIAFLGAAAFFIVFLAGYIAGTLGWWILAIVVLITYPIIYKMVSA